MSSRVGLHVSFVTFQDDRLPITNITDTASPSSFVLTTGSFPHDIVLSTRASSAKLSRIVLTLNDAKDISLEKSTIQGGTPSSRTSPTMHTSAFDTAAAGRDALFQPLAQRSLARGNANDSVDNRVVTDSTMQLVVLNLNPQTDGKDIRELRLRIHSGYSEFVGVYSVEAWGEESQQRIAVLEKRPDVTL